ncbi:hypothetical protein [Denitrobaculum tricleocarpae]|uniref:Uncharacterized protein n=1 Tax=Denitrobaculum tricleocarpae TaxID=2591009 RepID=A0A545TB29_9PROT|nr:hypothetical protein [Denitrobaculum tricleocarpae]TQV74406.1 hypothetical protein FKG95_24305 [Denitrobaculum tricleocarpae]
MLMELIATFALGFCAAGVVMLLRRFTSGRLPRWSTPLAAGLAMISFTLWSEYTWFSRTEAGLPESFEVVTQHEHTSIFRPWTKLTPFVDRFSAIDKNALRRNEQVPGQVMAEVLMVARHTGNARLPVLIDCPGTRRADLSDGMEFDEAGALVDADWFQLTSDDPLLKTVCAAK